MNIKNIHRNLKGALLVLSLGGVAGCLSSCSDTWDNHYTPSELNGTETLYQLVETNPDLSDFAKLLKSTHVYNNTKRTPVTYADLLDADQTLTVWAPVNGTYNVDSLIEMCQTELGDSIVAQHFVRNHIAHNLYNMNSETSEHVKMLNDKFIKLTPSTIFNSKVVDGKYNISATNGLLHVVNSEVNYTYNIYEGITSMPEFAHIGPFFANYEQLKLDEKRSIVAGIEDGMKIYSDSVMVKENMLFKVFDQIMNEDSNFVMMLPSAEVWNEQKQQAASYFNYGNIEKADSISNYWNHVVLLQDLFWNKNSQRSLTDSIFTTSFTKEDWPYHVYYNPYQAGGYLDAANITDSISCSNGMIYRINQWPFTPEQIYFHPVIMEGEKEEHLISSKDCTVDRRKTSNKNVSKGGYLDIVPRISTVNWTAEFEIKNNLSGTYDICIVTLPKTVHLENSRDQKPNKFKAVLHYVDENGAKKTYNFGNQEFSNNGETIDTVSIGKFTFPVSNYKLQDATVSLELKCSITTRQTSYSREMYLDCIYLKPSEEEDTAAATKARKEVRK